MPQIEIRESDITGYSSSIESGASQLQSKTLSSIDNESTITGNKEAQIAFERSQAMLAQLMETVNRESGMIKQLGSEFVQADNYLAQMISSLSN